MKQFTKVPKTYVKANVDKYDLSTAKYGDPIYIDSGEGFRKFMHAWRFDDDRSPNEKKFRIILSDAAIKDFSTDLSYYLYDLALAATNFNKLKLQISETTTEFYYNVDKDFRESAKYTLEDIRNSIMSLHQLGLNAEKPKGHASKINIRYRLDPEKYNLQSTEYQNNVESISRMLESIPSVSRVEQSEYSDGSYAWYCYINKGDGLDSYPQVVPAFDAVPKRNDDVTIYKVAVVTRPQYMTSLRFRYAEPNKEMYVVQNITLKVPTSSPEDFMSKLYENDAPFTADSWEQVTDYFDNMPYISNGALIINTVPCKITQTINGKSKTIYNKSLPDASNIEME